MSPFTWFDFMVTYGKIFLNDLPSKSEFVSKKLRKHF